MILCKNNDSFDNRKPIVLVDIDGVIVDFQEGVRRVLKEKGILFRPEWQTTYNYDGNICCKKEQIYSEFRNPELYLQSPFTEKALEALNILSQYANAIAYTKVVKDKNIFAIRREFCSRMNFQGYYIYYGINKDIPEENIDAVIDDCPDVIQMWADKKQNTQRYIIKAPYNKTFCDTTDAYVADNFYDSVYQYVHNTALRKESTI